MTEDFKRQLLRRGLLALTAMGGRPMAQDILIDSMSINWAERPPRKEVEIVIAEMERLNWISGVSDPLNGSVYALTALGTIKANDLR